MKFNPTKEQLLLGITAGIMLPLLFLSNPGASRRRRRKWFRFFRKKEPFISMGREKLTDSMRLRHTHIVGATGTGKTVLLERLLFEDLTRGYGAIVIDPKGERNFYESVKAHCASIGRSADLHYLSATYPDESATWNPCILGNASELQTKFFNSATYSEPHYAKACEYGLLKAFKVLTQEKQTITLNDLVANLRVKAAQSKDETLEGLFFDLCNLVDGEWGEILGCDRQATEGQSLGVSLGQSCPKSTSINLLDTITNNKILFVDLPTEGKRVQSSRIGKLLTQEIILISGMRKRNPSLLGDKPFSVYIDEFDAFATEAFATFLNKGRSSRFMIHIAHQTLSDLNCVNPDFAGQILGNCNVRFIFRQDDPDDAERWSRFIGTQYSMKSTFRAKNGMNTGDTSNREVQEFVVPPDTIKSLGVGECVFSVKTEDLNRVIRVPFNALPEPPKPETSPLTDTSQTKTSEPSKWDELLKPKEVQNET